jgi:hypothetical protein
MKSNFIDEQESTGSSLFNVRVSSVFGPEHIGMFDDMARFIMIQFAIQIMLCTADPDRFKLFSADFLVLIMFVVIGVMFYWLVFKKIVGFK